MHIYILLLGYVSLIQCVVPATCTTSEVEFRWRGRRRIFI